MLHYFLPFSSDDGDLKVFTILNVKDKITPMGLGKYRDGALQLISYKIVGFTQLKKKRKKPIPLIKTLSRSSQNVGPNKKKWLKVKEIKFLFFFQDF